MQILNEVWCVPDGDELIRKKIMEKKKKSSNPTNIDLYYERKVREAALSQITNVGPNLGQAYIVDSFMVVVFGGVGNLWGTLVAGFSLGIANKVLEPYAGAVLAKILVLVFIILFIQKRPRGLFPQKGRAAES